MKHKSFSSFCIKILVEYENEKICYFIFFYRYIRGTLSPTANATPHAAASPGGQALLRAARDGDDGALRDLLRRGALIGLPEGDLNAVDSSGRVSLQMITC